MKKNNLILILLFVVALMAIVFAALSTSLSITGSGSLSGTWGPIYITKCACKVITSKDSSNPPTASCAPTTNSTTSTVSGTITTSMKLPGDKIACSFTVKNAGSFHAAVPTMDIGTNTYFTVSSNQDAINAGGTGVINVYVEYKSETSTSHTITVNADYKQSAATNTTKYTAVA